MKCFSSETAVFCSGNKKDLLGIVVQNLCIYFLTFYYSTFTLSSFFTGDTTEDILDPTLSLFFFLFSYPIMPPQFVSNLSSLPAPSLPFAGFGFWVTFFLLVFISNWHFVVFNLQGGTMGTFYYTEWYEKPCECEVRDRIKQINEYLRLAQDSGDRKNTVVGNFVFQLESVLFFL